MVEDDFSAICIDVCKIPKIFQKTLFEAIKKEEKLDEKEDKISKKQFENFYENHLQMESVAKRVFKILSI